MMEIKDEQELQNNVIHLTKEEIISDVVGYEDSHIITLEGETAIEGLLRYLLNKYYPEKIN